MLPAPRAKGKRSRDAFEPDSMHSEFVRRELEYALKRIAPSTSTDTRSKIDGASLRAELIRRGVIRPAKDDSPATPNPNTQTEINNGRGATPPSTSVAAAVSLDAPKESTWRRTRTQSLTI